MGACASRMGVLKSEAREGVTPIEAPSTPKADIVKPPTAAVTDTEKVSSGGVVVAEKEEADVKKCGNGEGEKESGKEKDGTKQRSETAKKDRYSDEAKRRSLSILFQEDTNPSWKDTKPRVDDNGTKEREVTPGLLQVKVSEAEQIVEKPLEDADDKVEEKQSVCDKVSEADQVVGKPLEDAEDNVEEKQSFCDEVSKEVQIKAVEIENLMMSTQYEQAVKGKESAEVENKVVEVVSTEEEHLTVIERKVVKLMPVLEPIADKPIVGGETAEVEVEISESNQSISDEKVCVQEQLQTPETDNKVVDAETPDEVIKEQQVSEKRTLIAELKVLEAEIAKESTQEGKPTEEKSTT